MKEKKVKKPLNKAVRKIKKSKAKIKPVKISQTEQLSKVINKVQLNKKEAVIYLEDSVDPPVVRNIIKDAELKTEEIIHKGKNMIRIIPNENSFNEDIDLENLNDEFSEFNVLF